MHHPLINIYEGLPRQHRSSSFLTFHNTLIHIYTQALNGFHLGSYHPRVGSSSRLPFGRVSSVTDRGEEAYTHIPANARPGRKANGKH